MFHSLAEAVAIHRRNIEMATAIPIPVDLILAIDLIFPPYDVTTVPSTVIVFDEAEYTQYPDLGATVVTASYPLAPYL